MRKMLLITFLVVPLLTGSAFGQADPGDLGIFFDPAGTQSVGTVLPYVPFFMYVVAFDTPGNFNGYEGSITYDFSSLIILSAVFTGPYPINYGTNDNWIVGTTGGCVSGFGPVVLVSIQFLPIVPVVDSLVCLGPSSPSSFVPPTPGYLDCAGNLFPFGLAQNGLGIYPNGCAVINWTSEPPIPVDRENWGAVKARF